MFPDCSHPTSCEINTPSSKDLAQHHLPRLSRLLPLRHLALLCFVSRHSLFAMQFKVGDIIHNKTTQEEGRIARIADLPGYGLCYIVSVTPNPNWGITAKEAIWKPSEVSD
jgi:hypothetical protein